MKLKQDKQAETIAEIKTLAVETGCAKSADDMLESYAGREEKLLRNLRKMKLKQDKKSSTIDEIKTLMAELEVPKEKCDKLFEKYDGKEDMLLKNMRKMSSRGNERMSSMMVTSTSATATISDDSEKDGSDIDWITAIAHALNIGRKNKHYTVRSKGRNRYIATSGSLGWNCLLGGVDQFHEYELTVDPSTKTVTSRPTAPMNGSLGGVIGMEKHQREIKAVRERLEAAFPARRSSLNQASRQRCH